MFTRHKPDHDLDPFREGLAILTGADEVLGHLASVVETFWGLGRPFGLQERVWILVTWSDGRRERIAEDYPPWTSVTETRDGWVSWETDGREVRYAVT